MKNFKNIFLVASLVATAMVSAQVKIGDNATSINASTALEIESTNKGFLMPRMANPASIASPATGLQVYNTTTNTVWFYNGTAWTEMGAGASGTSIYSANGQLAGVRTVDQNNNNLTFQTGTAKTIVNGNFQTTGLLYAKAPRVHPIASSITWQDDDVVILLQSTHSGQIVFPSASANPNRLVGINNRSGSARIIANVTGGDTGIYADEALSQIASASGVSWYVSDGISWRLYSGRP